MEVVDINWLAKSMYLCQLINSKIKKKIKKKGLCMCLCGIVVWNCAQ
jgi:hypothetical protein